MFQKNNSHLFTHSRVNMCSRLEPIQIKSSMSLCSISEKIYVLQLYITL